MGTKGSSAGAEKTIDRIRRVIVSRCHRCGLVEHFVTRNRDDAAGGILTEKAGMEEVAALLLAGVKRVNWSRGYCGCLCPQSDRVYS